MTASSTVRKLAPVVRRRLHEEVVEQLVRAIHAGDFPVESRLPSERELSSIFGVTRPVIREALQSLERLGAVRIAQGERAEVIQVTPDMIVEKFSESVRILIATDPEALEHFKDARLLFECAMARLAAQRATKAGLRNLQRIVSEEREAKTRRQDFIRLDGEFHAGIAGLVDNPLYTAVSRGIFNWLSGYHVASVSVPGREDLTVEEHMVILAALEAGDAEAAERAMHMHLTRANDLYHRLPNESAASDPGKVGRGTPDRPNQDVIGLEHQKGCS
jgi:GntR family transcriptional regulator, sialic acid-inducible nan operon repressor